MAIKPWGRQLIIYWLFDILLDLEGYQLSYFDMSAYGSTWQIRVFVLPR
jgi:hypothetical protein